MTVELCQAACKANGYRYAGLEYYGQCTCGGDIEGTPNLTGACSYACTGNVNEICGGSNALSIYIDPTYPVLSSSIISQIGTFYNALGCYTEVDGRVLTTPQDQLDGSTMTIELCLNTCGSKGYAYAGVEYAGECYCGGILAPTTSAVDGSQCNLPCNGNNTEFVDPWS